MVRRILVTSSFVAAILSTARASTPAPTPAAAVQAPVQAPTPDEALAALKEANARYVAGESTFPHLDQDRRCETTDGGQHPIATILGCSDSRVPPELLFDSGVGDLFVVRVAGNVADTDEIGSIEYGAGHLHTPLIVVIGHTKCGAVTAVVKGAQVHGSIPKLIDNVIPAVDATRKQYAGVPESKLISYAIKANVRQSMRDVLTHSDQVRSLVAEGKTRIVGAIYDLHNGTLEWLGEHPEQAAILSGVPAPRAEMIADDHATAPHPAAEPETSHEPKAQPAAHHAAPAADSHPKKPLPTKKPASHAADEHGAKPKAKAHDEGDSHGAAKHPDDVHVTAAAKSDDAPSLVSKHGLLVPGAFLAAGSALSGTVVFLIKNRSTAAAPAPAAH